MKLTNNIKIRMRRINKALAKVQYVLLSIEKIKYTNSYFELELRNIAYKVQAVDFIIDEDDEGYEEMPEPIITKIIDDIDDDLI